MKRKEFINIVGKGGLMVITGATLFTSACRKDSLLSDSSKDHLSPEDDLIAQKRQGFIEAYPANFDYGDVIVGESAITLVTIQNIGDTTAILWEITLTDSTGMFEIRTPLYPPIELNAMGEDGDSLDIEVAFVPKTTGFFAAMVTVDTLETHDVANLSGMGVRNEPPPPSTPIELQNFYNEAVDQGKIIVDHPSFTDKLNQAAQFYEEGKIKQSCNKLEWLYQRCDGNPAPPDLISGIGVEQFRDYLTEVMETLGCN